MNSREQLLKKGVLPLIGNTPILRINSLSELTGCDIFMKCEHLNPGGTVKDRPALNMILEAIASGALKPGMTIVEGTAGNTGIGLAMVGHALGFKVIVVMPKGMAPEKHKILKLYGAEVVETEAVPFTDDRHFFKVGKKIGQSSPDYWWANQFDNPHNYLSHYKTTGPEMYAQMNEKVDAVVVAAGSGGTAAGISKFMKEKNPNIKIVMPDPQGSTISQFFKEGEFGSSSDYTMTEGVGICRFVENFRHILQDECYTIEDQKLVTLAYWLKNQEGLVMGMSSMLNLAGAFTTALRMGPGHRIITILCDGAERALSKMYNPEFLAEKKLSSAVVTDAELKNLFLSIPKK